MFFLIFPAFHARISGVPEVYMSNTPYRILYCDRDDEYAGWEFDEAEFESSEAAYEATP
jgi:hypothetical protein